MGATCDSAEVLRRLLPHQDRLSAAFPINDRPAVEQAFAKGVGAELTVSLGATLAPALMKRRKFHLLGERVRDRSVVTRIFERCAR